MSDVSSQWSVGKLAELVGGKFSGAGDTEIYRVASLETAQSGEISFLEKAEFTKQTAQTNASCLIVPENFNHELPCSTIQVKNPKLAFAIVTQKLHPLKLQTGWHKTAEVAESSDVRASFIGAFVKIGENSQIGESTQISDGVKIGSNVSIGKGSVIEGSELSHTIIGTDAKITKSKLTNSLIGDETVLDGLRGEVTVGDHSEVRLK